MKSIDKFVLVLVASLALLLAGCGGGSSSNTGDDNMDMDISGPQKTALMNAHSTLQQAVNALVGEATQDEVNAANAAATALQNAINAATDVAASDLAMYRSALTSANTAIGVAQGVLTTQGNKEMAAVGKALRAALAGPAATNTALDNITGAPTLSAAGLAIDAAVGAGALEDADDPASVTLEAGDSAGALGSWTGTDYAHSTGTGDAKVTNEARVYTNRGAPDSEPFSDVHAVHTTATAGDDIKGYYTVDETADLANIMGATFTHSGTQNHTYDSNNEVAFTTRGTFDGAPGEYRCTGTCSSTNDGKGSPSALGGVWHFKPDSGAMVSQPDTEYLYYGWWVSKDSVGDPTAASAFAGVVEPTAGGLDTGGDLTALTGSASYAGNAAGKFAMSNTLDGTGNGGHFTADANLKATFGTGATAGVTGTIDNFRLNDGSEDPGWSVALARGGLGAAGAISAPASDPTVWSINGNKAPASGTWSGTMYDEMPGDPPGGDGSSIPTTVTGTFYSEFSTIGRMVGAFGADKE